jgi:hypothetical protein
MPFLLTTPPPPLLAPPLFPPPQRRSQPLTSAPAMLLRSQRAQASSACLRQRLQLRSKACAGERTAADLLSAAAAGLHGQGPLTDLLTVKCIDRHMPYMMPHPTYHASISMYTPVTTATVYDDHPARSPATRHAQRHKTCHSPRNKNTQYRKQNRNNHQRARHLGPKTRTHPSHSDRSAARQLGLAACRLSTTERAC